MILNMNICFNEYLQKILPSTWSLNVAPEAFILMESFLNTILLNIQSFQPHTAQDLEKFISSFVPSLSLPIIQESHLKMEKNQNKQYFLLFDRITLTLQKEYLPYRLNYNVSIILASFLECISLRIFKQLEKYANIMGKRDIDKCDVNLVIHAIKEFNAILSNFHHKLNECNQDQTNELLWPHCKYYLNHQANNYVPPCETNSMSYADLVKLFISEETNYIKDLKLLLKLFKKNYQTTYSQDMDGIFGNLDDIYYLSVRLLWMLEDIKSEEECGQTPGIGYLLEELTMCAEFDVYDLYAEQIVTRNHYDHILSFLTKANLPINTSCPYASDSVWRYVVPHLLFGPIIRCFNCFNLIQKLGDVSQSVEDRESLSTTTISLEPLKAKLNSLCPDWFPRSITPLNSINWKQWDLMKGSGSAMFASKIQEVKKCIEGWEDLEKDTSTQLLMEGSLGKLSSASSKSNPKKMVSERYAFAFDGVLVLSKIRAWPAAGPLTTAPTTLRRSSTAHITSLSRDATDRPIASPDFRIKEWFLYRSLRILPRDDIPDYKYAFELSNFEHIANASSPALNGSTQTENFNCITLYTKNERERQSWLSLLLKLSLDDVLEKNLTEILDLESKSDPCTLLPYLKDTYRFAQPDTSSNLILEERPGCHPIVKGGTFDKLVERLTHHNIHDTQHLSNFLIVYRSFATPATLFKALVDRFNIPNIDEEIEDVIVKDAMLKENSQNNDSRLLSLSDEVPHEPRFLVDQESVDINIKEKILRFRRDYMQIVQNRVLNVFRHWILAHFYDFQRDPDLMAQLLQFVNSLKGKWKKICRDNFNRNIQNKLSHRDHLKQLIFSVPPPPIEWHLAKAKDQFALLTLHPVELARQLTLYEFELYSAIKPSELVGSVWTKTDKHYTSPNLLKMTQHSTKVTYWLERCIVYTENLEERVAVLLRIIEILSVLNELNNFNGVLEFLGALSSAPVYRLDHTFKELPNKATKVLEEAMTLISDRHFVRYKEKLNSINPPCVPFLGVYMSDILHIEEGNPDRFPTNPKIPDEESREGDKLINFYKWIKVAEVCREINIYQNLPYCLAVEMDIRTFILELDPFNGAPEKDIDDILYEKSLEIEPKNCKQPPKFERRLEGNLLKSPGIKVTPVTSMSTTLPNSKPAKPQPLSIGGHSLSNLSLNSFPLSLTANGGAFMHSIPPPSSPDTPTSPGVTSICSRTALIESKASSLRRGSLSSTKIKNSSPVPPNPLGSRHARFFQRFQSMTTPTSTHANSNNAQSLPWSALSPGPSPTDSTAPLISCQTSPFNHFSDVTLIFGQNAKIAQNTDDTQLKRNADRDVFTFCQSPSNIVSNNIPPPLPPKMLLRGVTLPPPLPPRQNASHPPPLPPKSFKTKLRRDDPL